MMIEKNLGKKVSLTVVKRVDFGVYLGTAEDKVLLPAKQVPEGVETGDSIEVFLYKDSRDRLIATTREPKLVLGQVKALKVLDTGKIGAFLDWGLEKDLLLPFREQTAKVKPEDECLVSLYVDKSGRLCATMKVYEKLQKNSPYKKDDRVQGIIYEISDNFGWFVAVDDTYCGLIPKREICGNHRVGDRIEARVTAVKPDGKLDLSIREKAFIQMDMDAKRILEDIRIRGGAYPFTDKAGAELIKKETGLSRNAFKRAIGKLLKTGEIIITDSEIHLK